ncbi:MAG TPA: MarC family protein [Methanomassiliicoccales archaeon]|jgi:multiple antibiotic resistance protein
MDLNGLIYAATLLFFIFDPFASIPIFICMTKDLDDNQKTTSANRAVLVAALLFAIFAILGTNLLAVFSVTLDGFRIAGGIVLLLMAIEIIFSLSLTKNQDADVAWVIIATPILTGPGVITTAILLVARFDLLTTLIAGVFSLIITWVLLRNAASIIKIIGNQAIEIFSKIIGLLLAAMAVEFIMRGAIDYVHHAAVIIVPIL